MPPLPNSCYVLVACSLPESATVYREALAGPGHEFLVVSTGAELIERCRTACPTLAIVEADLPDMSGLVAVREASRKRPLPVVLVFSPSRPVPLDQTRDLLIVGHLIAPPREDAIKLTLPLAEFHARRFDALRQEVEGLRQALEDRKLIEQAKGAIMRRLHVNENDAFRLLRQYATDRNRKLVEASVRVLEAAEVFLALERRQREADPAPLQPQRRAL